MKRTFQEFIHFFNQDESEFGDIARAINADVDFSKHSGIEEMESYLLGTERYRKFYHGSKELLRRYKEYTDDWQSDNASEAAAQG